MKGLNLDWKKTKLLEIVYSSGQIYQFRNFWDSSEIQNYDYRINVSLQDDYR
jgi:hypothetical protein